jgi:hypothetical protein
MSHAVLRLADLHVELPEKFCPLWESNSLAAISRSLRAQSHPPPHAEVQPASQATQLTAPQPTTRQAACPEGVSQHRAHRLQQKQQAQQQHPQQQEQAHPGHADEQILQPEGVPSWLRAVELPAVSSAATGQAAAGGPSRDHPQQQQQPLGSASIHTQLLTSCQQQDRELLLAVARALVTQRPEPAGPTAGAASRARPFEEGAGGGVPSLQQFVAQQAAAAFSSC